MTQHPIAAFLHARYSEIEQRERAKFAINGLACCKECGQNTSVAEFFSCVPGVEDEVRFEPCGHTMTPTQFHETYAEPDPDEFVLADIAGKRLIVEDFRWWWDQPDQPPTDAELHARCSHPEWEYTTTEGPRKAWDDADQPPDGGGWERNIEVGWNGWEQYNLFEESYWRRRRTPEDAEERRAKAGRPPLVLRALALPFAQHRDYQEGWKP